MIHHTEASPHDNEEDDVSFDNSMSSNELSIEANQSSTSPKRQLISGVSFYEGVSRLKSHWKVLLYGQVLSFFLALSGATASSLYYECNVSIPTIQAGLVYLLMALHLLNVYNSKETQSKANGKKFMSYTRNLFGRGKKAKHNQDDQNNPANFALGRAVSLDSKDFANKYHDSTPMSAPYSLFGCIPLYVPWWVYFLFALASVQATYFSFLAFKYTSLMSASLLDNFNIFSAMIASRLVLKRRYSWKHIVGVTICLIGVCINLISDFQKDQNKSEEGNKYVLLETTAYPHKMIGDLLAILGGVLFGVCDVFAEVIVNDFGGIDEYLGCVGFFGLFISMIQAVIIERKAIAKFLSSDEISMELIEEYDNPYDAPRTCSQDSALVLLLAFTISGYLFHNGLSRFLTISEVALLMLSILTADLWAILFTVFAQHIMPSHFFFLAFALVMIGVVVYEMSPSPLGAAEDLVQINNDIELDEKNQDQFQVSNLSLSWDSEDETRNNKQLV